MARPHDASSRRRISALAAALMAGSLLSGGVAFADTASGPLQLAPVANPAGFSELVTKVKPAVVNIATEEIPKQADAQQMPQLPPDFPFPMFRHFFEEQQQRNSAPVHALGSGFIVDPEGYIVTNNHVVDGAHKITITLDDGTSHPAKLIGRDAKTDLALLKIDADKPLPYVAFGNSAKENVGDWVIAVGNPFGLGGTVTAGIVSAHGRNINAGPYDDFLQIDAPINPGNSGGPLFNQSGQVVGIDSAIYSPNGGSVGIGFAIPSNLAAQVVAQLREHGSVERGWLGVQMQPMTEALAKAVGLPKTEGVLIDDVLPDSPAAKAELQQGDVITQYGDTAIKTPRDLAVAVANTKADDTAKLTIWRDGHDRTVSVRIAKQDKTADAKDAKDAEDGSVGMALTALDAEGRSALGIDDSVKGVVVAEVSPGSRAAESGIRAGDVIVRVSGAAVSTPKAVANRIHDAEHAKKEAIPLLVSRNGTTYYIALELAQG